MSFLIVSVIAVQVFIFLGFILFFRRVLTSNVVSATKHLGELSEEYTKKEEEADRRLEEAKRQAQEIVAKAVEEAQAKKEEIMKLAEKERGDIIKQARSQSEAIIEQADRSREVLIAEMEERVAKEAVKKASELIQRALPDELKLAAHSQWVRDLIESGFEKIGKVRIAEGVSQIKVVTAFPLKENDRAVLLKKVNEFLGRNVALKEELDPKIVAGIIVEIGNLVLDGSLRNKILEQTSALDAAEKDAYER